MADLIYLNVYAVTRHYGGPEEGGWWFNAGEPLASIPLTNPTDDQIVKRRMATGGDVATIMDVIERDEPTPRVGFKPRTGDK